MRAAAHAAGMISNVESDQLRLALEPESAIVAAVAGTAPDTRNTEYAIGKRLMIVDCGGGTIDVTESQIVSVGPIVVEELAPASGGPWGGM